MRRSHANHPPPVKVPIEQTQAKLLASDKFLSERNFKHLRSSWDEATLCDVHLWQQRGSLKVIQQVANYRIGTVCYWTPLDKKDVPPSNVSVAPKFEVDKDRDSRRGGAEAVWES